MFHRIHTYYRILTADGTSYLPRAYGEPASDGSWNGYLAFFPRVGTLVATDRQINEPTLSRLKDWAGSLSPEELHAALGRAEMLSRDSLVEAEVARLKYLENEAELDAETLEEQAELDKAAATNARADAERLRREREAYEEDVARLDERAATADAEAHEKAAKESRAEARRARTKRRTAAKG